MSERLGNPQTSRTRPAGVRRSPVRAWAPYVAGAIIALLALAYFDAGEEPIRPIVQPIAVPNAEGGAA